MAVLTSTGITFSDTSALNSKYGIIPQSAAMIFFEISAPTGWTQVGDHNDKALRVVSTAGGGSGGTNAFSSIYNSTTSFSSTVPVTIGVLSVGDTTLDTTQIPAHSHAVPNNGPQAISGDQGPSGVITALIGSSTGPGPDVGGGSHSHPISYTSASGPGSASLTLDILYVNMIICTFN